MFFFIFNTSSFSVDHFGLFTQKLCPCVFAFGCSVINLEHLQRAIWFHSESCLESCNILMFWAQLGIWGRWKGSADSHSASSYRLRSPRADTDTVLIIQTSARKQKEIEATFFFCFFLAVNLLCTFHIVNQLFSQTLTFLESLLFLPQTSAALIYQPRHLTTHFLQELATKQVSPSIVALINHSWILHFLCIFCDIVNRSVNK